MSNQSLIVKLEAQCVELETKIDKLESKLNSDDYKSENYQLTYSDDLCSAYDEYSISSQVNYDLEELESLKTNLLGINKLLVELDPITYCLA